MPIYVYACDQCFDTFEVFQNMSDDPLKRCNKCNKCKLYRVPQAPIVSVKINTSDIKKLGHLAERNGSNMGKYEYQDKRHIHDLQHSKGELKSPEQKEAEKRVKKIKKMTQEQKVKYVETGEGL